MLGPSRPPAPVAGPSSVPVGPVLPPHLQRPSAPDNEEDDDDDEDDYAPALPPVRGAQSHQGPQGPALPPHLAQKHRAATPSDDSSDDDDVGPRPAPSGGIGPGLSAAEEFRLREKQRLEEEEERKIREGQKPKREAWMTVPPSELDGMKNVDPSKITKTGFNQHSKRGAGAEKASDSGRSLWTETPQERAQRLDDEASGKRKRIENAGKQETDVQKAQRRAKEARNAEMRNATAAYNAAAARGDSLVDMHAKKAEEEQREADEKARKKSKTKHRKASRSPSPQASSFWDRDKMMGSAGRFMEEGKKKEMLASSSINLSSKFGSGTYL